MRKCGQVNPIERNMIREIAVRYANSAPDYTVPHFVSEYDYSKDQIYKFLKRAIVEHIVSEGVAKKIARKAAYNSNIHGGANAKRRSERIHAGYLEEREFFMFDDDSLVWYMIELSKWQYDVAQFVEHHCLDMELLDKMVNKAIASGLLSEEVLKKVCDLLDNSGEPRIFVIPELEQAYKPKYREPECEQLSIWSIVDN